MVTLRKERPLPMGLVIRIYSCILHVFPPLPFICHPLGYLP